MKKARSLGWQKAVAAVFAFNSSCVTTLLGIDLPNSSVQFRRNFISSTSTDCVFPFVERGVEMLDEWIAHLKKGNCIPEPDLKKLCIMVRKS